MTEYSRDVTERLLKAAAAEDYKVRARLAEVLSSAGVHENRVALEILYLLPKDFVAAYTELFHNALSMGDEGKGAEVERKVQLGRAEGKRVTRASGDSMGGARKAKKKAPRGWAVKSTLALQRKEAVDRKLRKLAREVMSGEDKIARVRCGEGSGSGCGKWLEDGWSFCPGCGVQCELGDGQGAAE